MSWPRLTLRQNKYVLSTSKGKWAPKKSGHKPINFISQILGSQQKAKIPQNVGKPKKGNILFY